MPNTPRGIRNNNPGNLNFANQPGAVLEPKTILVRNPRFAKFHTMDDGITALLKQLKLYFSRDIYTVSAIISKWAPPTENVTSAYISYVAQSMRVGKDDALSDSAPNLAELALAIMHLENGQAVATYNHVYQLAVALSSPGGQSNLPGV